MTACPKPVVLCILDGWGAREPASDNAISCANIPVFRKYWGSSPHALLQASGEDVGLPAGQIGNSEVGHMNIGAGRVVFQDLPMIDRAIANGELEKSPALLAHIDTLGKSGGTCHLMGLVSPGGVHAHQKHMVAIARIVADAGVRVAIHAFLDGRDVPPESAGRQIQQFCDDISDIDGVDFATLCGRYYAMDRDKRWERTQEAYDLVTGGEGALSSDPIKAIKTSYAAAVSDEFVQPVALGGYEGMKDGDGLLFANFRADRARQLLSALCDPSFDAFLRKRTVRFSTVSGMVEYSDSLRPFMSALFPPKKVDDGLGEVVSKAGLKQLRIAETEKYAHVTFFFNGGREAPFDGEERILVPSPKVKTYDLMPEMSAREVTDRVINAIERGGFDFIVVNYANPDMVGHTGILSAAIKAVETVDECLGRLFAAVQARNGMVLLTADHGNCECMYDPSTRGPQTAHTLSPVPVMLVGATDELTALRDGRLADIAPTILDLLHRPKPACMDGRSLIVPK